jgi:WD40 repeat protein
VHRTDGKDGCRWLRWGWVCKEEINLGLTADSSATVFSPETSAVRENNLDKLPVWLRKLPQMEDSWASLIQTLAGHSGWVRAVAFSPDSKQIASGSDDGTIKLWDVAKALKVSRLLGSTLGSRLKFRAWQEIKTLQTVDSLKFSINDRHLVTNLGLIKIESNMDVQSPEFEPSKNLWGGSRISDTSTKKILEASASVRFTATSV